MTRPPPWISSGSWCIIPTTCGTGSEVTNISIMARTRIGTKLGLVSPAMYADYAVLIPQLLEGLPFKRVRRQLHRRPGPRGGVRPVPQGHPLHQALWL